MCIRDRLDVTTVMTPSKQLANVTSTHIASGAAVTGYEIHIGETTGPDATRGWLSIGDRQVGATSTNGDVRGCYLHGIFSSDDFRATYLEEIGARSVGLSFEAEIDATLDALADHLEACLDITMLERLAAEPNISALRP